jgi:hypothetical protein
MAKLSVALFGYNTGSNKRAQPGDIIEVMPIDHKWSDLEKKHFLIIEIDSLDLKQVPALKEPIYDTSLKALKYDSETGKYLATKVIKKRRFNIPISDLSIFGVNLDDMLNKEKMYVPKILPLAKTDIYDTLNSQYINTETNLETIKPISEINGEQ